jgi:hypothetical protein
MSFIRRVAQVALRQTEDSDYAGNDLPTSATTPRAGDPAKRFPRVWHGSLEGRGCVSSVALQQRPFPAAHPTSDFGGLPRNSTAGILQLNFYIQF